MHWFKHLASLRKSPQIKAIEKVFGEPGYARALKLMELVAENGGSAERFRACLSLKKLPVDLAWLAEEWGTSEKEATKTLNLLAKVGFIEPTHWRRKMVCLPEMKKFLDEWTKRCLRRPSGVPHESSKSRSAKSQSQSQSENQNENRSQNQNQLKREGKETESEGSEPGPGASHTSSHSLSEIDEE